MYLLHNVFKLKEINLIPLQIIFHNISIYIKVHKNIINCTLTLLQNLYGIFYFYYFEQHCPDITHKQYTSLNRETLRLSNKVIIFFFIHMLYVLHLSSVFEKWRKNCRTCLKSSSKQHIQIVLYLSLYRYSKYKKSAITNPFLLFMLIP